jgi:hypothetical protein
MSFVRNPIESFKTSPDAGKGDGAGAGSLAITSGLSFLHADKRMEIANVNAIVLMFIVGKFSGDKNIFPSKILLKFSQPENFNNA